MDPEDFVSALYQSVLRRMPDPDGLAFWSSTLRAGGDPLAIFKIFLEGDEFARFGGIVTRPDPSDWTGGEAPVRYEEIGALAADQTDAGLPPGIDIIVPACNAENWIAPICDAYRDLGLRPLFIVEGRSRDRTLSILRTRGERVFTAQGKAARVESLLCGITPYLSSTWVLRLDDDEMPSRGMLAWIAEHIEGVTAPAVAFPRLWVRRREDGGLVTSTCEGVNRGGGPDRSYRLFRPGAVIVTDRIHTPGFEAKFIEASPAARLYHFDWLVRDYAARLEKVAGYEAQAKGGGHEFSGFYLPEEREAEIYGFRPMEDPFIAALCDHLVARAGDAVTRSGGAPQARIDYMDIALELPSSLLPPRLRRAMREERYEVLMLEMIGRCLRPTDVVLQLGSGIGFVPAWIARRLARGSVVCRERNPFLAGVAANNFRINGVDVEVDGLDGSPAPRELRPDIVIVGDYETPDLLDETSVRGARHVIVAFDDAVSNREMNPVFARMAGLGLGYDPAFSSAQIVTFSQLSSSESDRFDRRWSGRRRTRWDWIVRAHDPLLRRRDSPMPR